jgi:hypothetical protein
MPLCAVLHLTPFPDILFVEGTGETPPPGKAAEKTPLERFEELVANGKVEGEAKDIQHVRDRLTSARNDDRVGAAAEVAEMERQIAKGVKPKVGGGRPGPDTLTSEVKGEAVIDLGEYTTIDGEPITEKVAREMVKKALSKGRRGENITNVIVKDGKGNIIYSGLGK